MRYIDEFRNKKACARLIRAICNTAQGLRHINIMEVCGTHTMSICRSGIREMLPANINLISGPGCPVCVTPKWYIDAAIWLSRQRDTLVATFGDMVRVPGSASSLRNEKARGAYIKVVYSPMDALMTAGREKDKKVVFLGIGFETTSPLIARTLEYSRKMRLRNFFVLSGHKIIIPAMEALLKDRDVRIDGFLCPAHVSTIIGIRPYRYITDRFKIPCVIAGFEPVDILQGILMIIKQIRSGKPEVENQYRRVVRPGGNRNARAAMDRVFITGDSEWRGLGVIKGSGLFLNRRFRQFDAAVEFKMPRFNPAPDTGCICESILRGVKTPAQCPLFARRCTPENPRGACMVSSEGTCAAYYKYRRR